MEETSLDTLLTIKQENEFQDIQYCIRILERIFSENRRDLLDRFVTKITPVFYYADDEFRKQIILTLYSLTRNFDDATVKLLLTNSVIGNLVLLHRLLENGQLMQSNDLTKLHIIWDMQYLHDEDVLRVYPFNSTLTLNIQNQISVVNDEQILSRIIESAEVLFHEGFIKRNRDSILSFYNIYSASNSPKNKLKAELINAMLEEKIDLLASLMAKLGIDDLSRENMINKYEEIYKSLLSFRLPIYFEADNLIVKDNTTNDNFYFLIYTDMQGNISILFPYKSTDSRTIQKVFDPHTNSFLLPKGRIGKLSIEEVHSFSKIGTVKHVDDSKVKAVKDLYETQMEDMIRQILKDYNRTADSPAERIDVLPLKIQISGPDDLRNAGFILKGRNRRVNLKEFGANLLKAIELPIDIIFFIYNGTVEDEPIEHLIKRSNEKRTMYCVLDAYDFARLLVAYEKI